MFYVVKFVLEDTDDGKNTFANVGVEKREEMDNFQDREAVLTGIIVFVTCFRFHGTFILRFFALLHLPHVQSRFCAVPSVFVLSRVFSHTFVVCEGMEVILLSFGTCDVHKTDRTNSPVQKLSPYGISFVSLARTACCWHLFLTSAGFTRSL